MAFSFEGVSALVIDCDGTLLDSMPAWDKAEAELISRSNMPFTMEMLTEIRAAPMYEGCRIFHERYGVGNSVDDVVELMDELLLGGYANDVEPVVGAPEFVRAAKAADVPLAVASSSPQRFLQAGLKRTGLIDLFDEVVSTEDVLISKEDPAFFLKVLELLDAPLEGAWGVDDAIYAIRTMKQAGLRTIAKYDSPSTGTYDELLAEADITIREFKELM